MIKLKDIVTNNMLQDYLLYEGLIKTETIDTLIDHLERWAITKNKFGIKVNDNNTIILKFKQNIDENELDNIIQISDRLGWYIGGYFVNMIPLGFKKFDKDGFLSDIKNHSLMTLKLEAKYDLEINKYDLKDVYHITDISHKEKIDKIGLCPKTQCKNAYHPDRIYLATNENDTYTLAKAFKAKNKETKGFVIYKIDIDGLRKSNNGIRFFRDPNLKGGVYTLSNIPPKFLTIYKTIENI